MEIIFAVISGKSVGLSVVISVFPGIRVFY
jgi:hypothetical protein